MQQRRKVQRKKPSGKLAKKPFVGATFRLNSGTGIPERVRTTLTYSDLFSINPGTPRGNYIFRGNSVYDPDYTTTGHQPRYFDQYMGMYERFRVLSSTLHVEGLSQAGDSGAVFVVVPDTNPMNFTAFYEAAECPRSRTSALLPIAARYPQKLTHKATTHDLLGLSVAEQWDEDYSGTISANPQKLWYWNVFGSSAEPTGSYNVCIYFRVTIYYEVLFYDRIYASPSKALPDVLKSRDEVKSPIKAYDEPARNYVTIISPPVLKQ